jgi:hypothetical protein
LVGVDDVTRSEDDTGKSFSEQFFLYLGYQLTFFENTKIPAEMNFHKTLNSSFCQLLKYIVLPTNTISYIFLEDSFAFALTNTIGELG